MMKYLLETVTDGLYHEDKIEALKEIITYYDYYIIWNASCRGHLKLTKYLIELVTEGLNKKERKIDKKNCKF